jgi:solute carrier family 25 2-oxodicarboxylate transporter 21
MSDKRLDSLACTAASLHPSSWKLRKGGQHRKNPDPPTTAYCDDRATKFAANDEWGKVYRTAFGVTKMTQSLSILTGASAGATEALVVVPFELVKIRLQDKASAGKYTGMIDVVRKTVAAEGPLAMYTGLESTLWRHIMWNAGYFGVIYQIKALLPKQESKRGKMMNDLVAGSIGGTVGTMLNTPYTLPIPFKFGQHC